MSDSAIRRIQVRKSASRSRHAPGDIEEYVATFFRLLRRVAEHSIPARRPKCDEHGAGERTLLTFDKQQNANAARAPRRRGGGGGRGRGSGGGAAGGGRGGRARGARAIR